MSELRARARGLLGFSPHPKSGVRPLTTGQRHSLGALPWEMECAADGGHHDDYFLGSTFYGVACLFPRRDEHQILKIKWKL